MMSAHADAHLRGGVSVVFICVTAATSLVPGTEKMPLLPQYLLNYFEFKEKKEELYIFYFHPCQFLKNFLLSNSLSALEVGHAVGFIYWSLYVLTLQTLIDHLCDVPGTKSIAVDQYSSILCSPGAYRLVGKRTIVRRALTRSGWIRSLETAILEMHRLTLN